MPGIELGVVALDDPHRALGPGETGELRVKGPNVTRGYWNRPQESAASFADGYFLTGDIGYMDEDGYFFIVDRKKDMILSGGFNVYPQMIEQAIYEHPAVNEVLVVGVPDSYRGESAKALSRLRAGRRTVHAGGTCAPSCATSSARMNCRPRSNFAPPCRARRSANCRRSNCARKRARRKRRNSALPFSRLAGEGGRAKRNG